MSTKELRAQIGGPEDIAVVGPRYSGKTTITTLYAEHLAIQGKKVLVVTHSPFLNGMAEVVVKRDDGYLTATYTYRRVDPKNYPVDRRVGHGLPRFDVVIHDGYIPDRPCRVIATSEIL